MNRRFIFRPRRTKTQPPGTVIPILREGTDLECPTCHGRCHTLPMWNPWLGYEEPMILAAGGTCRCPHEGCKAIHWMEPSLAREYNHRLYPEDPQFQVPAPGDD
jgi:hypothetical protein